MNAGAPGSSRGSVIGMPVDAVDYASACGFLLAPSTGARYACVANVHMAMECHDDPAFAAIIAEADLVVPDGMPLVWTLRLTGWRGQTRVYGPTLMLHLCAAAAGKVPIALYGGTGEDIAELRRVLAAWHPDLRIAYAHAPPFRPLAEEEEARDCAEIVASGARLLLVGLGCPKQERWMRRNRHRLPLTAVGVGAAFAFHAGRVRQAPALLQRLGLEWAFRLMVEPRRLWRRYLLLNPRFVALSAVDLLRRRR